MLTDEPKDPRSTADADLILRTRSGDGGAFGELWRRHYPSGMAVARSITSSIDPDDLVQESYTRIYQAVLKGGGPNGAFRAYLFTSIRNTAAAWGRSRRETAMDELDTVPDPDSTEQAASEALDRGLTAQAFRSLPTRWQEVLWYTEIEQMKPGEVGPLLGMKAGAVSQLAFRAREGLREAWVQAHLRSTGADSECHWTIEHLGAHSRGNLSTRDRKRVDAHLDECARCLIVAGEAKDVSSRLALVLLPLVLGVSGAAGYAALLQSGGTKAIAVAAMPSGVVSGGVVAGEGVVGLPVGVDGTSAAGGAGGAGGTSGGAITGIGALVGAGSAALVVAGVVAAATIVPGLVDASPVTSLPNAGDADDSSISTDVAPDSGIDSTEKPLLKVSDDAPEEKDEDRAPETTPPAAPPVADEVPDAPTETPVSQGGDQSVPPVPDPGNDEGQEEEDNGGGDGEDNDGGEGGEPEPEPEPEPSLPEGAPDWAPATQTCIEDDLLPITEYAVPLTGAPDSTVSIHVDGLLNDSDYTAELGADGTGTATLRPTGDQIALASRTKVSFNYVLDDLEGEVVTITLADLYNGVTCLGVPPIASDDPTPDETAPADEPSGEAPPLEETAAPETSPVEESVAEEPVTEEPVAEEPAPEEPQAEEPVTEEPVSEEPVVDAAPESAQPTEQTAEGTAATEDTAPAE